METQYQFTNKVFGQKGIYGIKFESVNDSEKALFEINSYIWTPEEVQNILDAIDNLEAEQQYDYQVEGGHLGISIFTDQTYFFDLTSEKETEDFIWSTQQFIDFLIAFKSFLEEN